MILATQHVWLPHTNQAFVPATLERKQLLTQVFRTIDGEVIELSNADCENLEYIPHGMLDGDLENLTLIATTQLSLAVILHTVRARYKKDEIYTAISDILVSVNPYKMLNIYNSDSLNLYLDTPEESLHSLKPHVYKVAARAWRQLLRTYSRQSIVVSGESGAGMMSHFCHKYIDTRSY